MRKYLLAAAVTAALSCFAAPAFAQCTGDYELTVDQDGNQWCGEEPADFVGGELQVPDGFSPDDVTSTTLVYYEDTGEYEVELVFEDSSTSYANVPTGEAGSDLVEGSEVQHSGGRSVTTRQPVRPTTTTTTRTTHTVNLGVYKFTYQRTVTTRR